LQVFLAKRVSFLVRVRISKMTLPSVFSKPGLNGLRKGRFRWSDGRKSLFGNDLMVRVTSRQQITLDVSLSVALALNELMATML
jgi:hypothetical protein